MSPAELIALSLGLSVAAAVVGGLMAAGVERISGDPTLRERAWATALYMPALPPLAMILTVLTPAPVGPAMEMPTVVAAAPWVEATVAAAPVAETVTLDWGLVVIAVLAFASLLILVRLISLGWRTVRLHRLIDRAVPAAEGAKVSVAEAARALGIVAPAVRATNTGTEALLAGLVRPVLILPAALAERPETPAARAVIAHELAHLKRGDHRAVWVEEGLLAILAVNPLLPLIRARRAAAREEACDALALGGAQPTQRRAYAQSLIEALRARTDVSPAVALPALTFTGTPRSRAMRRLKSILTPPATAGRGTQVAALCVGASLLVTAGMATVAVAAQREMIIASVAASGDPLTESVQRLSSGSAADLRLFCAAPANSRDRDLGCDVVLWNAALAERQTPSGDFCAPGDDDAGLALISQRGRPHVLIGSDTQGSARDSARRALIAAFPCNGVGSQPGATQLTEAEAALSAEWSARHAARSATEAAAIAAGFRSQTVADIKRNCAAGGTDGAGCDGLIFGVVIRENMKPTAERTFCAPEAVADGPRLAERVKGAIVLTPAQSDEAVYPFLTRVLTGAYPCGTQAAARLTAVNPLPNGTVRMEAEGLVATSDDAQANLPPSRPGTTRLLVRLSYDDSGMVLSSGDRLRVGLDGMAEDGSRNVLSSTYDLEPGSRLPGLVWLDLGERFFPKTSNAAYTLTAQIDRGVDEPATFAASPSTIRLAPMSQGQLGRLQPELTLRPVTSR